jgi:hypothetical protein
MGKMCPKNGTASYRALIFFDQENNRIICKASCFVYIWSEFRVNGQ